MLKKVLFLLMVLATTIHAEEAQIIGVVAPKCIINIDTPGVYGNPSPNTLSTSNTDGGVPPIIRFDIIQAGYYKAVITTPNAFSSSPSLTDAVTWTGSTVVNEVTDAGMSVFTDNMITYNTSSEFDLTVPGSVWFKVNSAASYGYNRAFPSGTYRSIVTAECIAK